MRRTIRSIRQQKQYSTLQMAQVLQLPIARYWLYEHCPNLTPVAIAKQIAKIGGIAIDDIFFG